jgi:hypothetical protein
VRSPPQRLARSGPRRLALFFALIVALEAAVRSGRLQYLHFDPPFDLLSRLQHTFLYWSAHFLSPLVTMVASTSIAVALLVLALRGVRGAAAGRARDPVIALRDFFRRHRWIAAVLPWAPALSQVSALRRHVTLFAQVTPSTSWQIVPLLGAPLGLLVVGAAMAFAGRCALRSLDLFRDRTADTVATRATSTGDEMTFQAVAVTLRTRGAVLGVVAVTLAVVWGVCQPAPFWMRDAAGGLPLVGYALAVAGAAAWFRKASTIAVGRDGIFLGGASRKRFHSYQDFDEVRLAGRNFDLYRAGERVLRLQLHGADRVRAAALAERIRRALAASAHAGSDGTLLAAATHAGSYRRPSISPEQLWALVEGDGVTRHARLAAASALATSADPLDRARLRVAATRVVEPKVRIPLEELALADEVPASDVRALAVAPGGRGRPGR